MAPALPPQIPLIVDPYVPEIRASLGARRAAVVVAEPGAGKTTRIPPALAEDGPLILLQPRRVAARAIARRIAEERGWTLGAEVGWHVRFDRHFSPATRLLVATEGILTARLQHDPLLTGFTTIVLDEFHERSIHADLGLALAKQAWAARDDLRILVMSATLDAGRVAAYLGECPVFRIPGTLHPVDLRYQPGGRPSDVVGEVLAATPAQVLCFLPGAAEIRREAAAIRARVGPRVEVVELHGSQTADEQDRATAPAAGRRVIVATNLAETSLTVPGVRAVVDSGQHKVARYDPERGVDSLALERISRDAADQRAGRAGRLGPGVVRRLWSETDRLRPHREPDIARVDLSGPVLDLLAWGADPDQFEWFEPPSPGACDAAMELLRQLGAVDRRRLTELGRAMSRLPLHPRLARILLEAQGAREAAIACAVLSDRHHFPQHPPTTSCDLLVPEGGERALPDHVVRNARELQRTVGERRRTCSEGELRRALFTGYPDRVARRRTPADPRVLLSSGHGAAVGSESGVRDGEFLVALDVQAGARGAQSEARIRLASVVDRDWLTPTRVETTHEVDPSGIVRAVEREMYGSLVLRERHLSPDPGTAASRLAAAFLARPLPADAEQLLLRLRFAGLQVDPSDLAVRAAAGRRKLDDVRLEDGLDWNERERVRIDAPPTFAAPSGRTHTLEYRADGTVALAIKLQELFGLPETPLVGRVPLLILLLAPNGRPVQTTADLRSFWTTTYQEVRKELRGRYPRHPWPEDPWKATPTARTTRTLRR